MDGRKTVLLDELGDELTSLVVGSDLSLEVALDVSERSAARAALVLSGILNHDLVEAVSVEGAVLDEEERSNLRSLLIKGGTL